MEGTPLIVDGDNEPVDTRITNHRTPISPLAHGSVGRHDQPLPPGPPPHGCFGVYSPPRSVDPVPLAVPELPRVPPALAPWDGGTLEARIAA